MLACMYCGEMHSYRRKCVDERNFSTAATLVGVGNPLAMHYGFCECLKYAANGKVLTRRQIVLIIRTWERSNPDTMIDCALWATSKRDPEIGGLQRSVVPKY